MLRYGSYACVYPQVPTQPPLTALLCLPLPNVMLPGMGQGHGQLQHCAAEMLLSKASSLCHLLQSFCSRFAQTAGAVLFFNSYRVVRCELLSI